MKKLLFTLSTIGVLLGAVDATAQVYRGGIPWSVGEQSSLVGNLQVALYEAPRPDYERAIAEDEHPSPLSPYRVGIPMDVDLGLESGTFTYLKDGSIIWRLQIRVPEALAVDLYYDQFQLPAGVALYLSNANGKQLEGAYTYLDNLESYTTPFIQGEVTCLEMNIPAKVNISDIKVHINSLNANYRGGIITGLNYKFGDEVAGVEAKPTDDAAACHTNAICEPWGNQYYALKQAVACIKTQVGLCSGSLINNTAGNCKPLFLTASHCEGTNADYNSKFNSWQFYFTYEYPLCEGNVPNSADQSNKSLTSAIFVARSDYDDDSDAIASDFLLLELRDPNNRLGNNWNAYLGGWNRLNINTLVSSEMQYIGFHHPKGDPKKVTVYSRIYGSGNFNGGAANSHWAAISALGGTEGGSSGSPIFSMDGGYIMGDLSGGPTTANACDTGVGNPGLYSKLGRDWDNPQGGGSPQKRLKDHLDPTNSGVQTLSPAKLNPGSLSCTNTSYLSVDNVKELNDALFVYPNPSSGLVNVKVNLMQASVLNIDVVDISGRVIQRFETAKMMNGDVSVDISSAANGMYLLRISSDKATVSKKITLSR